MTASRERILNKLRTVQRPFEDAVPRPESYRPVTSIDTTDREALLERFTAELERLNGEVFVVDDDEAAKTKILELLESHNAKRILAWKAKHLPVTKLYTAIQQVPTVDYIVEYVNLYDKEGNPLSGEARSRELQRLGEADVGLTGADAVAATTGTLIMTTAEGKSRLPTVLPPVHIAVVTLDQFIPRIEDWLKQQRDSDAQALVQSGNVCFITGPSRTADIEKKLVLGVHGPKYIQVVVKRS